MCDVRDFLTKFNAVWSGLGNFCFDDFTQATLTPDPARAFKACLSSLELSSLYSGGDDDQERPIDQ